MSARVFYRLLFLSFVSAGGTILPTYSTDNKLQNTTRYYCTYHLKNGERASQYFDRLFLIKRSRGDTFTASFPLHIVPSFEMRQKGNTLYGYFQSFAGKRRANEDYREEYDLFRLNIQDGVLVESHVKYASQKYYEWFKADTAGNPYSAPFSSEPMKYIDNALPKGLIKFGWNSMSFYRCRQISYPKYLLHSIGMALYQILGA